MDESSRSLNISVAICTYNGEKYIQEQLQSILNQTLRPDEIVLGDDGSSDSTLCIVREFAKNCPIYIKIIQNHSRAGYRDNFLSTSKQCKGELIAFCDQDDVWLPEKLSSCARWFTDKNVMLVCHGYHVVNERLHKMYDVGFSENFVRNSGTAMNINCYPGFSQVFRSELLKFTSTDDRPDDVTFEDQKMAHDRWVPFVADSIGKTVFLSEKLSLYRQHGSNLFGDDKHHAKESFFERALSGANFKEMDRLYSIAKRKRDCLADGDRSIFGDNRNALLNIGRSIEYWDTVAKSFTYRKLIYGDTAGLSRLRAFSVALKRGAYIGKLKTRFRAVTQDLIAGLIFRTR